MALIATMITYNDYPIIKECMGSVIDKVDKIVVIDGKFKDFPGGKKISDDGTLEYLYSLEVDNPDKVTVNLVYNETEIVKRNFYFNYLNDGDICLNIDTDEVLIGHIPKLTADIGTILIGEKGDRQRHRRSNRFFKFRKGLHYWGTHKMILNEDGRLFANLDHVGKDYTSQKITEFEFLHNNHKRDYNRQQDKKKYYQILMKREAKINEPTT